MTNQVAVAVLVLGVFALTLLLSTQSFVREESLHIGKRILNTRNGILKVDINSDVPKVGHLRSPAVEPRDSILKADIDSDVPKVGNLRSLTAVFTASASSDPCLGLKDCNLFNVPEGQDPFGQDYVIFMFSCVLIALGCPVLFCGVRYLCRSKARNRLVM